MDPVITVEPASARLAPHHQIHLRAYAGPEVPEEDMWLYTIVTQPWPFTTAIAGVRLARHSLLRRHGILLGAWPFIRIRVRNGHAIYRIETLEQGAFDATLVDSQYTLFQPERPT
jgi:hypothetical protein